MGRRARRQPAHHGLPGLDHIHRNDRDRRSSTPRKPVKIPGLHLDSFPGSDPASAPGDQGRAMGPRALRPNGRRRVLHGTAVSVHSIWKDAAPAVHEVEQEGPDEHARIRDVQCVVHGHGAAVRVSVYVRSTTHPIPLQSNAHMSILMQGSSPQSNTSASAARTTSTGASPLTASAQHAARAARWSRTSARSSCARRLRGRRPRAWRGRWCPCRMRRRARWRLTGRRGR